MNQEWKKFGWIALTAALLAGTVFALRTVGGWVSARTAQGNMLQPVTAASVSPAEPTPSDEELGVMALPTEDLLQVPSEEAPQPVETAVADLPAPPADETCLQGTAADSNLAARQDEPGTGQRHRHGARQRQGSQTHVDSISP